MKKMTINPTLFFLGIIFSAILLNCRSNVKHEPGGINVPGLAKNFSKIKKVCEQKGKKGDSSNSLFVDTTTSTGKNLQIVYDPDKYKIQLTVFERKDDTEIVKNVVLFKGKNEVKSGDAWVDIDLGGSHIQQDMTEADLKEFLAKF